MRHIYVAVAIALAFGCSMALETASTPRDKWLAVGLLTSGMLIQFLIQMSSP